jgi:hypothetical protein
MTTACTTAMMRFLDLTTDINIYDVYGICYQDGNGAFNSDKFQLYESKEIGISRVGSEMKTYKKSFTARDYTPWAYRAADPKHLKELPPCTFGLPIIDYLNSATVRTALHIPDSVQAWDLCTESITYQESHLGSQWVYEALQGKYRMLFYSGDTDGAVPTYGSIAWINQLNWDVVADWRPYFVDG